MSTGIYLFCLTPADPLPEIAGTGIDELHPLFVETIEGVCAILSEVVLEDFSGPDARERLEDLAWIGPRALRHEEVIMVVMRRSSVLPVRFGTVFSSLEAMAESLRLRQDVLAQFFLAAAGKKEWTIKGYVDTPRARSWIMAARMAAEKEQLEGLSPGRRYFSEQKIKGAVDRAITSWLKEMSGDIIEFAREVFMGFSESRLHSRDVTGGDFEMFFHGVFFVPDRTVGVLGQLTDDWNARHAHHGLCLELSGPWPPYHFVPVLETGE